MPEIFIFDLTALPFSCCLRRCLAVEHELEQFSSFVDPCRVVEEREQEQTNHEYGAQAQQPFPQ